MHAICCVTPTAASDGRRSHYIEDAILAFMEARGGRVLARVLYEHISHEQLHYAMGRLQRRGRIRSCPGAYWEVVR